MFRCTDCDKEYEVKPDYCDCGNDTFVEVSQSEQSVEPVEVEPQKIELPKIELSQKNNVEMPEIYSEQKQKINFTKYDFLSILIFVICIILSVLSWVFIGKDLPQADFDSQKNTKQPSQAQVAIPSIDKLWKDAPQAPVEQVQETIPVPKTMPVQPKVVQKPVVQTKKETPAVKKQTQQVKKVDEKTQKPTVATSQQKQTVQKKSDSSTVWSSAGQNSVAQNAQQTTQNVEPVRQKPVKPAQVDKAELAKYKLALRNRLVSSMDFTKIVGDGNCTITFNVSENGKLINRKFAKQSLNDSLNSVVFDAMLKNPSFNPPPEYSAKENYSLNVKIYGGNFEVELK